MWNGNSAYSNGNSFGDDGLAATLPWLFRVHVPSWQARP